MKKTMKKFGVALSLLACMGLVAGCGGGKDTKEEVYTIGINQFADHGSLDNCREGFIEGLRQAGYEEGVNVEFEYSVTNGDLDIDKVISKKRRKKFARLKLRDIEYFAPFGDDSIF